MVSHGQSRNFTNSPEKRDRYNDSGLGICGTNKIERQREKESNSTSENKVEMAEMRGQIR